LILFFCFRIFFCLFSFFHVFFLAKARLQPDIKMQTINRFWSRPVHLSDQIPRFQSYSKNISRVAIFSRITLSVPRGIRSLIPRLLRSTCVLRATRYREKIHSPRPKKKSNR
jgi:hypothetical protein